MRAFFFNKKNGGVKMKKKLPDILLIVTAVSAIIAGIYIFVFYKAADKSETVEAYASVEDYPVYSGREAYEYWKSTLNDDQKI